MDRRTDRQIVVFTESSDSRCSHSLQMFIPSPKKKLNVGFHVASGQKQWEDERKLWANEWRKALKAFPGRRMYFQLSQTTDKTEWGERRLLSQILIPSIFSQLPLIFSWQSKSRARRFLREVLEDKWSGSEGNGSGFDERVIEWRLQCGEWTWWKSSVL